MTNALFGDIIQKNIVLDEAEQYFVRGFVMMYENEGIDNKQTLMEDSIGRKILDAAIAIIEREGYENLTIRRVAKESGCSNSAIYVRFADKDALTRAIAVLNAKPFLMIMDESYVIEDGTLENLNRITKNALERVFEMDIESVNMQMKYCGSISQKDNPFFKRVENYIKLAIQDNEIPLGNSQAITLTLISAFWGFAYMVRTNRETDLETAKKMLEKQNEILLFGFGGKAGEPQEDSLWTLLKEQGVNVDKALERMKGNKEAYRSFLKEFFEDPDFEALQESIEAQNAKEAFEYAHGLKGMAGNLGLDYIHSRISILVEILRQGSLEGAAEAFAEIMETCTVIAKLL